MPLQDRVRRDDRRDLTQCLAAERAARNEDLAKADHRFGLGMVAAIVRSERERPMHTAALGLDGAPEAGMLPTTLAGAHRIDGNAASWAAKVLIATTPAAKRPDEPFRLRAVAQRVLGLWLEVGPASGEWSGAMVGVAGGAEITNHAVGPRGGLPECTVLE